MQIKAKCPSYGWRQGRWWTKEMQIRKEIHSPSPSYSLRLVDRKSQEALTAFWCSHKKAFDAQEQTNTTPLSRELTSYPINVCWLEFRRVPASSGDHIDCWPNLRGSFFLLKQGEQAWVKYSGNIRGRDYKTTGLSASAMVEVMGDGIMMLPQKGIWHSSLVQNNSMKL